MKMRLIVTVGRLFTFLITISMVSSCALKQSTHRESHNRLYTSSDIANVAKSPPKKSKNRSVYFDGFLAFGRPVSDLEIQIKEALRGREKVTPLVIYVHGRGDNMAKTVDENIVGNLENNYGVAVIQFHWQSQNLSGWNSYPMKQSIDSAPNLVGVLNYLKRIRMDSDSVLNGRKVHMLVHSMGNLMLREVGSIPLVQPRNVIDNLILNAPDVPMRDADSWLKELRFSKKITVVHYDKDPALTFSKWVLTGGTRKLGLDYHSIPGISGYYAEAKGLSHRHFGEKSIGKSNKLKVWFKAILN